MGLTSLPTSVLAATDNSAPLALLMGLAEIVVPPWIVQKVILLLILFLAGVGAARLPFLTGIGRYYAGLFYVLNPYSYVRLLTGQWGLLLGYALTPFALKAFIELLERPTPRNGVRLALLTTLVGINQVHALLLLALASLVFFIVWLVRRKGSVEYWPLSVSLGVALGIFLIVNLYWLVPTMMDLGAQETVVKSLSEGESTLYGTRAISSLGLSFDVASLHGFWRTWYLYSRNFLSLWWVPFLLMFFLAVYGFVAHVRSRAIGWLVLALGVLGLLSFILALGVATPGNGLFVSTLWSKLPGAQVFRDSHKFTALLALSYAFLGGLGLQEMVRLPVRRLIFWKGEGWRVLLLAAPLLPLLYTFPMVGLAGQVRPTDFPDEWYHVREMLHDDEDDYNVLFLPWHMYMSYSWLPNRDNNLANPASYFFGSNVIAGDNIEFGIPTQSVNPVSQYVEFLLSHAEEVDNLGELLAPLNVRYVFLAKESDYETYDFLGKQKDIEIFFEGDVTTLYRNRHPTSRAYSATGVVVMSSLEDLLELSRHQDIMEDVYLVGEGTVPSTIPAIGNDVPHLLTTKRNNRARYNLTESSQSYTIFVSRYGTTNHHWRADGRPPTLMNLGMMPTFSGTQQGDTIYFARWAWLIWLEAMALVATVLCLLYLWTHLLESTGIKAASRHLGPRAARLMRMNAIRRKRLR